jgi:hypothetical protein
LNKRVPEADVIEKETRKQYRELQEREKRLGQMEKVLQSMGHYKNLMVGGEIQIFVK